MFAGSTSFQSVMALDSAASFKARMRDLGLPQAHQDAFDGRNVKTFAAFAFISPYQPNSQDEKPFVDALTDILGLAPGDHLPIYSMSPTPWQSRTFVLG